MEQIKNNNSSHHHTKNRLLLHHHHHYDYKGTDNVDSSSGPALPLVDDHLDDDEDQEHIRDNSILRLLLMRTRRGNNKCQPDSYQLLFPLSAVVTTVLVLRFVSIFTMIVVIVLFIGYVTIGEEFDITTRTTITTPSSNSYQYSTFTMNAPGDNTHNIRKHKTISTNYPLLDVPIVISNPPRMLETVNDGSSTSSRSIHSLFPEPPRSNQFYDVIIVGAGWAGIKATQTLLDSGITSVLVLETNDYIGGRAKTMNDIIPGVPIDLGCEWLYTEDNNMSSSLNHNGLLDLNTTLYDNFDTNSFESSAFYQQTVNSIDGSIITDAVDPSDIIGVIETLWEGNKGFRPFAANLTKDLNETGSDASYDHGFNKFTNKTVFNNEQRQFLNLYADASLELEFAGEDSSLSLVDIAYTVNDFKTKYMSIPGKGFGNIAKSFSKRFASKIKLNAKVTKIDHEHDENVTISYIDEQNGIHKQVFARTVLVTVSLGVLKAGSITFTPALPLSKREAIDKMGFGILNKCIMYWENKHDMVWPSDKLWLELITPDDETSGKWTSFFNPSSLKGGSPILVGWVGGRDGIEIEDQSDEEVLEDVMKNLSAMFPSISRPSKVIITRWGKDESTMGSYSFQEVGRKFADDAAVLKENVGNVYFAGEATSENDWQATTVGSWETGEEVGKRLVSYVKDSKEKRKKNRDKEEE